MLFIYDSLQNMISQFIILMMIVEGANSPLSQGEEAFAKYLKDGQKVFIQLQANPNKQDEIRADIQYLIKISTDPEQKMRYQQFLQILIANFIKEKQVKEVPKQKNLSRMEKLGRLLDRPMFMFPVIGLLLVMLYNSDGFLIEIIKITKMNVTPSFWLTIWYITGAGYLVTIILAMYFMVRMCCPWWCRCCISQNSTSDQDEQNHPQGHGPQGEQRQRQGPNGQINSDHQDANVRQVFNDVPHRDLDSYEEQRQGQMTR